MSGTFSRLLSDSKHGRNFCFSFPWNFQFSLMLCSWNSQHPSVEPFFLCFKSPLYLWSEWSALIAIEQDRYHITFHHTQFCFLTIFLYLEGIFRNQGSFSFWWNVIFCIEPGCKYIIEDYECNAISIHFQLNELLYSPSYKTLHLGRCTLILEINFYLKNCHTAKTHPLCVPHILARPQEAL